MSTDPESALLVIDVQSALFDVTPRPFEADEVVARINQLTRRARSAGIPVVFVQHETARGALTYGSNGWQLYSGLALADGDYRVRKTTPDAFLRTDLEERLAAWGVENLIICGYATEFCVDTTTRRAAALGYTVQLVSDAHTTHDKPHASARRIREHHNATLPGITSFGPSITAVPSTGLSF